MMKIRVFRKILMVSFALCSGLIGSGQQQPDSLFNYLEIAAKNNPTVLQRYYEYEAALQKVPQVGSLPDPNLSVGVFISPMELLEGKQVADVRLMQMFPWFGTLKAAKDEMSLMAMAKFETFRDAKLQVFYDVQRTWYDLHKISQNLRISEENIEILQTIERLAIVRFKAAPTGNASLADIYRIQIEIGDLQNNIALLKTQWNTISALFNSYLNRLPDSPVSLPDTLIATDFSLSLTAISDSTLVNNPMLGMLQYEQQSLEARKQMVTRMGYPMIGVGLNYSIIGKSDMSTSSMNGQDMIMPMVTATLPIYRKKYKALQDEADLLKSATLQNYKATSNELKTDYYQAMQLYLDAQRRIKLYAEQFELASKTFDIMLKSFASSTVDLTDILRIRQQIFDYEYKQIEGIADYNTSIAWLKRLMASSNTENQKN
jgi:outer membrane protein TolC